ncbi:MAG: cytochrome C oxidase subunit I [Alphaproteobacteria bacterium]|nr:cytochrome C oxidase subunit I [Alphaproteobacteria bacterium]
MQMIVLAVSLVLMALTALCFAAAIRSGGSARPADRSEERRRGLIWAMLVVGLVVTSVSLREWPHSVSAAAADQTVNVTGGQWFWEIDKTELPRDRPIVFNVHTADVTHGFGVVNESGRLLFQMQAMPGYVNRVQYVFDKPGNYRVICLEYCGVAHHDMITEFTVAAN